MTKRVVGTVITKSFLAHARTLAESLIEHNPDVELYVLLADRIDHYFDPSVEPFHLIQLEELPEFDVVSRMCFYYTPFELCCALRGYLHEYIFNRTSAESWIFLDSDIMVFHSLERIFEQLAQTSILLTPHLQSCTPAFSDAHLDLVILDAGLYNAGFLGLRRTPETHRFIIWFKERLKKYCFNDRPLEDLRGFFVDQRWLNLVPLYFQNVSFLSDAGANVGHWNLSERTLEIDNGHITVNHQPLLFFHFSGWDIANSEKVSKYNPVYQENDNIAWSKISMLYRESLLKNQYESTTQYPYAFGYFDTGEPITPEVRRLYYEDLMQGAKYDVSAFSNPSLFQFRLYKTGNSLALLQSSAQQAENQIHQLRGELAQAYTKLSQTELELSRTQIQLVQAQSELEHKQSELEHKQSELEHKQSELEHKQSELEHLRTDRSLLWAHIAAMENSKFWKLAKLWERIKQTLKSAIKR